MLNASAAPNPLTVLVARIVADYLILIVPAVLVAGWLRGDAISRKVLLEATAAALLALLLNQGIGLIWQHPRPFMIGLGHTLMPHVADSSFPSDHLTLLWAVASVMLLHPNWRKTGLILSLAGIPLAWSRIYLGVHFPFDMIGAFVVAVVCAWICVRFQSRYVEALLHITVKWYRRLFAIPIRRGWVRN